MKYLIDSFSSADIRRVMEYYPTEGVTTNPAIVCREKTEYRARLTEIARAVNGGMLHVQTMQTEAAAMQREAEALNALLGKNGLGAQLFVKLPATAEGLKACRALKEKGVGITMTAIFSPQQALICARAGADFVAPYVNKLSDVGDGLECVRRICEIFRLHGLTTQVLSASFRNVEQVTQMALAGSHYITLPAAFYEKLIYHPMTELALSGFENDWQQVYGDKKPIDLI
ncbi:MAG: fructose-6-phosphate aldolase [Clostridia bacterium]|nr:fructose-6-phosphate aldolase [Clostridia bacterium]